MKKILLVLVTVAMTFSLISGCNNNNNNNTSSNSSNDTDERYKVVWINPLQNFIGYVNQEEAVKEAAKDYDIDLTILGVPSADGIIEKNAQLVEDAVAMKPDAILVVAFTNAMDPALKKAMESGIKVIASGSDPADKSLRSAFIGTDNKTMGIMAAETFNGLEGGEANIFIMMSQFDAANQVEAKEAFEEKIKSFPGLKLLGFDKDEADMATAVNKFDAAFRAHESLDAVWMLEGVGGAAAAKVAAEQNKTVNILEVDDGEEALDNIRSGAVYGSLAQNFNKMGYESVRLAYELLSGVEDVPIELDSGLIFINKDNVDTYFDDMQAAINKKGTPWGK